jgi:hypothetical protein
MSEKTEEKQEKEERQRARPSLVWPVILITLGVLWLLSATGTMDVNWWRLLRLWPVLLILWGFEVLIGGRSLLLNLLVVILALAVAVGVAFYVVSETPIGDVEGVDVDRFDESLGNIESARLDVDMPAGELLLGSLADSDDLIRGRLDLAGRRQPTWRFDEAGGQAEMSLSSDDDDWFRVFVPGENETWRLELSPQVELVLIADLAAGQLELDLAGLDVRELEVATAVGQSLVTLPDEGRVEGSIHNVIGQLVIDIPRDVPAQIRVERALTTVSFPARFSEVEDGLYQTEGWEIGEEGIDLTVGVVIGQVTIRDAGR